MPSVDRCRQLIVIETEMLADCGCASESVTRTTHLNVPVAVGFPVTVPVGALIDSPGGSLPDEMLQWKGAFPPFDSKCVE